MPARRSILLAAAFAALLIVIGVSATAVWSNARDEQKNLTELHDSHMRVNAALAEIQSNFYLAAILTRDYLLDSELRMTSDYEERFLEIQNETEQALLVLQQLPPGNAGLAAVPKLRDEIHTYWQPMKQVLSWTAEEKRKYTTQILRQLPQQRKQVEALASESERLISDNFRIEQERVRTSDQRFRASFGWTMALALLFGAAISLVTLLRMIRLERQSHTAESELRSLSAQLRTAQEEERKHLSRDLHDQVGQMLTGLKMKLANTTRLYQNNVELSSGLEDSMRTVENLIGSIRDISMLLRPSMLDDLGLAAALGWLAKETSRSSGIEVRSEVEAGADSLPEAHRTCLYRVSQEALTNVLRHSGARTAEVILRTSGDWVEVTISDDGRGFEVKPGGLGLIGMQERVKELGGSVNVISSPGRGTRIEIRLPRPRNLEEEDVKSSYSRRSWNRADRPEASS